MFKKNNFLFLLPAAVCGAAAGMLRYRMLSTGLDERGLLEPGNPYSIALTVLTVAYLAAMLLLLKKLGGNGTYGDNFPACSVRFGLSAAAGVLLAVENIRLLGPETTVISVFGILSGAAIVFTGFCRLKARRPSPFFHCLVCVYFILRLINSFRGWSADPQLQDYGMQLFACVSLMLFAFHRACCDALMLNRRRTVFLGLAAVYFCIAAVTDPAMPLFYAAGALWSVGAGCNLRYLPEE